MTILILDDNLLRLKQLQSLFSRRTKHLVACKNTISAGINYIKNTATHVIFSSFPVTELLSILDESFSIPIIGIGSNFSDIPCLQIPFSEEQAERLLARYAEPYYNSLLLKKRCNELEKENEELQQLTNNNERYLRKAAQLQRGLLKTTQYDDFPIYAKSRAVGKLGGDFYYYKRFENHLYFCVGDVVDHGADAAIYMTELLSFLISLLRSEPKDLLNLVQDFNQLGFENNHERMTATAILGMLDLDSGVLSFCNEGHEPPIVVGKKTYELITTTVFLPVGIESSQDFELTTVQLDKEDKLFLYTDGLTEEFNNLGIDIKNAYGSNRLIHTLEENSDFTIDKLGALALYDMDNYIAGTPQNDDITILCFNGRKQL